MNIVEPIKDKRLLGEILDDLEQDTSKHGKRMYLLFSVMLYTGLRVSDVVKLKKKNVCDDSITIREQKTGKRTDIPITPHLRDIFYTRLKTLDRDDYLFPSRNHDTEGNIKPITTRQVANDMKIIAKRYNIKTPFSCHSLRKTFGYLLYSNGTSIEVLRETYGHASEAVTRRYIGINQEIKYKSIIKLDSIIPYMPEKVDKRRKKTKGTSEELIVKRPDKTKQGTILQEIERKAIEKAARRKQQDHERYLRKKQEKAHSTEG